MEKFILEGTIETIGISLMSIGLVIFLIYTYRKVRNTPTIKINRVQDYSIEIDIKAMNEGELNRALVGKIETVTPGMAREKLIEKFHYSDEQIVKILEQEKVP